jgi:hypothetical protein
MLPKCIHGVPSLDQRCMKCRPETPAERREKRDREVRLVASRARLMEARRKAGK